jgi:phosphate:Na+ symporter
MRRLNKNICSVDSGIIYLDLLTNIERISDHAASIAKRVIMVNE